MTPRWIAIRLDVSQYCAPEFLERCGGRVYEISLVNVHSITHCCEVTPSYFCIPVDHVPERYPDNDNDSERLCSDLSEVTAASDPFYFHAWRVHALPEPDRRDVQIDTDDLDDDGESLAIEAYNGNPRF